MIALGMIGAGRWGGNWIKTLANLPGTELRWCCDVSPASLDRIRQQFPRVKTTTRLEDLLDDATLAGIVIATSARPILTWPAGPCWPASTSWSKSR